MIGPLRRAWARGRGRSMHELQERGLQAASRWLERTLPPWLADRGRALHTRLASDVREMYAKDPNSLHARFRAGRDGSFLASFDDRRSAIGVLHTRWPALTARLVRDANQIRAGRFDLLGYRALSFGTPIDWHLDPVSGRRAPVSHWSVIPYLDAAVVGDHKVVWELNRHQHFITLGRAYWATADESYADTIAQHIASWMDQNPPKDGINWASSLEVAFRTVSWIWALHFLRESPALTPALYRGMLLFLDFHGRHIERYLSTYFSPNTHLTGEALGLYVLGSCVPTLAAAKRFRETGRRVLLEQLPRQVRPDGVYVEQSPYYQRYTVDFYLFARALAERSGDGLGDEIAPRLTAAAEHLMYLMRPDRTWPLIGDDDGGQLLPLRDRAPNDYRPTLAVAAASLGRSDLAACAGGATEEVFWLLGADGLKRLDAMRPEYPTSASRAFSDGGFHVMRDDWSTTSDYAVVDAGDHGFLNGGHAHADALGIELGLAGVPIFVDPGTGYYTTDATARNRYRSTAVHNAVTLDGRSSSEPGPSAFSWASTARVTSRQWLSASTFDFFRGDHDGFARLEHPAVHERSVLFLKKRYWVVRDRVVSDGPHDVAVHFHCSPSIVAEQLGPAEVCLRAADPSIEARVVAVGATGAFRLSEERLSPAYGVEVPTTGCTFVRRIESSGDVVTIISRQPVQVRQPASGVIEIVSAEARDLLIEGGDVEGLTTDAALAWLRRCEAAGSVTDLVLLDVSRCAVDGVEVLTSRRRLSFVEARRTETGWNIRSSSSREGE